MDDILYEFIGIKDSVKAKELLLYFVEKQSNQYSFQNCLVAEEENEVIASINIYNGGLLRVLREPFIKYVRAHFNPNFNPEDETQTGEYYIDTFGVSPHKQGKGIGTKLLQYVIKNYTVHNSHTLGLLVDQNNPDAKKLYLKLGFKPVGRKVLAGKTMEHLQININNMPI